MTLSGLFVLASLTCLAALNALGAAVRFRPDGRAELGIVAMTVLFVELSVPVVVLGYAGQLTPTKLGFFSLLLFGVFHFALLRREPWRQFLGECLEAAGVLARLPGDGLRETARLRSPAFVGLVWSGGIIGYAFLLAVRYP
jgi:hypothetical protein